MIDIAELPEKVTLKVVKSESEVDITASSDTDILPHVPVTEPRKSWPDQLPIRHFAVDVQSVLQTGNTDFKRSRTILKLTKAQKHNILQTMARVILV